MRLASVGLLLVCGTVVSCYSSTSERGEYGDGGSPSTGAASSETGGSTGSDDAADAADSWDPTTGPVTTSGAESSGEPGSSGPGTSFTTSGTSEAGEASDSDDPSDTSEPPADCPRVRVTVPPGEGLNVRPSPSTAMAPLGTLGSGAIVDVLEVVTGEVVEGNDVWYRISGPTIEGYVWSGFIECTLDEPPTDGFFLPLECGMAATISQGNFGDFSHQGQSAYAFDFSLGSGTPLVAIADGTVSHMYGMTMPGDPCYDGGGQECNPATNYVTLLHGDGTKSIYAHLSKTSVQPGQFVPRGMVVGLSGSSGWSTGPHAHVAREEGCAGAWCQSIAVAFVDVPGDGVPKTGDNVVSGNCP